MDQVLARLVFKEDVGSIPPRYVLENAIPRVDVLLNIQDGALPDE
jgi:hypothetical protein